MLTLRIFRTVIALFLLGVPPAMAEDITLSNMIQSIQLSLADAQEELMSNEMLPLASVIVELNVVNQTKIDGRIGFWILKVGASQANSISSNVRMVLTPPSAGANEDVAPANKSIRAALAAAIFEGAAARSLAVGGEPPLVAQEFVVKVEFGVSENANGEINLVLPSGGAGAGGAVSASEIQRIILSFGA